MANAQPPSTVLTANANAAGTAIRERGKSLLAIGIVRVSGSFDKGDVVALVDIAGKELARHSSNSRDRWLASTGRVTSETLIVAINETASPIVAQA